MPRLRKNEKTKAKMNAIIIPGMPWELCEIPNRSAESAIETPSLKLAFSKAFIAKNLKKSSSAYPMQRQEIRIANTVMGEKGTAGILNRRGF